MMKALLVEGQSLRLAEVPQPTIQYPDEVLIRIHITGLCRTDIAVMTHQITDLPSPLIPGHEFSGEVVAIGQKVQSIQVGDRVTAMPLIPCMACQICCSSDTQACPKAQFLGLDRHGAFAEYLVLPARQVYRLPQTLSWQTGAYTEPVAASLAVLKANIHPAQKGCIYGDNRIAELTHRILQASGFSQICTYPVSPAPADHSLDFVIETHPTAQSWQQMISWLRPGGTLIMKSRYGKLEGLPLEPLIKKELHLHAVHYGHFEDSLRLMASGQLDLSSLMGPVFELHAYQDMLNQAQKNESQKLFLALA